MAGLELTARERLDGVGMIIRQKEPVNLEFPFSALAGDRTPSEQFYVRCHFPIPSLLESGWRLSVQGCVQREVQLTLDEITAMPAVTRPVTLECAGNGRIFLVPQVHGAQWELGGVSTADWTGVALSAVLDLAGVKSGAVDIVLEGADRGKPTEPPMPPDAIHYARGVPFSKAIDDVLLAYRMNGEPLPPAHGFPLRAIVPGWYGMASVKWLSRIIVTDQPFQGYFQTTDYAYWQSLTGMPVRVPITQMQVKAQIARPAPFEVVPRDAEYRVFGAAWAGDSPVTRVEVSTDGGRTFADAAFLDKAPPHAWQLWEYSWRTPARSGSYTLLARASDAAGHAQPAERNKDWGTYVVCHMLPVEVEVR